MTRAAPRLPNSRRGDSRRRRRRSAIVIASLIVAVLGLHAGWWLSDRQGGPVQADEGVYLSMVLEQRAALDDDGISGLVDEYRSSQVNAPFVPLTAVPAMLLLGNSAGAGVATIFAYGAVLLLATYLLARRVLEPPWAGFAVLVVAATPDVIAQTRVFYFSIPSVAFLTVALWCGLRSDCFVHRWWSVAAGASFGCAALSRTLMLGIVPVAFGAVALVGITRGNIARRVVGAALAGAMAIAIAASWYVGHFGYVVDYLRGARLRSAQPSHPLPPVLAELSQLVNTYQAPLAVVLTVGAVIAGAVAIRRRRGARTTQSRSFEVPRIGDVGALALVAAGLFLVMVIAEGAWGRWITVIPPLTIIGIYAITRIAPWRARAAVAGALVVAAVFEFVIASGAATGLGRVRLVDTGVLRTITITDGRSFFEMVAMPRVPGEGRAPAPYVGDDRWSDAVNRVVREIQQRARQSGDPPIVLLGRFDPLFNPGMVVFAERLWPSSDELSVARFTRKPIATRLCDPKLGQPTAVLSFPASDVRPRRLQLAVPGLEQALEDAGYADVDRWRLPDGRPITLWWRERADVAAGCQNLEGAGTGAGGAMNGS